VEERHVKGGGGDQSFHLPLGFSFHLIPKVERSYSFTTGLALVKLVKFHQNILNICYWFLQSVTNSYFKYSSIPTSVRTSFAQETSCTVNNSIQ